MSEAFTLYTPRASGLHRLHPLTRLALAGLLLVAGLTLPGQWATYAALALVVVPLGLWGRVLPDLAGAAWRVALPFAISVFLVQGLFWPGGTPVLALGPLSFKREGIAFAVASTGRILLVVSSFLLCALTTRPDALMTVLTQRGLPGSLAYIVVATIQIVPRFQARAASIVDAQRARGLETEGNVLRRIRAVLPLVVPLVLSSLVDVEERAIAVEARGFSRPGPRTSLLVITEARWEPAARWMLVAGMLGLLVLRLWPT